MYNRGPCQPWSKIFHGLLIYEKVRPSLAHRAIQNACLQGQLAFTWSPNPWKENPEIEIEEKHPNARKRGSLISLNPKLCSLEEGFSPFPWWLELLCKFSLCFFFHMLASFWLPVYVAWICWLLLLKKQACALNSAL